MFKNKEYNYIAMCLCAFACIGWSYVIDLKYYRLAYYSWDLALYSNLMWNLCHGSVATSLFGKNFLVDHFDAIAFLLIPFYYLYQSALTILYFKIFAFFAGAYVFYLLTAKRLGGLWGILFLLAYICYPANVGMFFFEFNFENLALPLIFLLFYYFEEQRYLGFIVCCVLLTMVKENMPLLVFMFGIYGFFMRRKDWIRWGLYPFLLGVGTFLGEVFVLIPWLRHGYYAKSAYWNLYSTLGNSPPEILRTLLFNWPKVFKVLLSSHNISYISKLFGPLLLAALLAPQILFLAAPLFLENLLSNFYGQQSIYFFYSSTLAVFIFMAAIEFLGRIQFKFKAYLLGLIVIFLFYFDLSYWPQWQARVPVFQERQAAARSFLSQIPSDAKVLSSYKFLYLFSQRKDLYVLYFKQNQFTYEAQIIPDDIDYMVVDFASRVENKDMVKEILNQGQWKVQDAVEEMVLLRKSVRKTETLIRTAHTPFLSVKQRGFPLMVGSAMELEGIEVPAVLRPGQRIMPVVFYWKALSDLGSTDGPQILLSIFQGDRRFYLRNRTPLYGLPVQKGEYDREVFYYFIPLLSSGEYSVHISNHRTIVIETIRVR